MTDSSCPFDLLDAGMRDPFLQQAFRQLDQRHLYGIIARVCRSWHHLSTTSNSSLTAKISTALDEENGQPEAAISFSNWLQHNISKLTALHFSLDGPFDRRDSFDDTVMMQAITSATQLCSLGLSHTGGPIWALSGSLSGASALTSLTSLTICHCVLPSPVFSSILVLTQLRALELRDVAGYVPGLHDVGLIQHMPRLASSLMYLTKLTLRNFGPWELSGGAERLLPRIRTLTRLMELDISDNYVPSSNIVQLVGGLPVTGINISLVDPGHVSQVSAWLESCVPATLKRLTLEVPGNERPRFELQASQVSCLLSPLRSAGSQLQALALRFLDLSALPSVTVITGLTQLSVLYLLFKCNQAGWALLRPAFAHLEVKNERRRTASQHWSVFHTEAALLDRTAPSLELVDADYLWLSQRF